MVASFPSDGPELVLGLVAPVGVELPAVAAALRGALLSVNYEALGVNVIDAAAGLGRWTLPDETRYDRRVDTRMTFGDQVRGDIGLDGLALISVGEIKRLRQERTGDEDRPIARVAYLIRSLKTPEEVNRLRDVYGSSCFIVATYASRDIQLDTLARQIAVSHHAAPNGFRSEATALMRRDEIEHGVDAGQNLRETFPLADVFLDGSDPESLRTSALRFVEILFAHPFRTPSRHELGMFFAHGASLRSASPGRQVGACIATRDGDTVSIGTNEVPKARGGQYWEGDTPDERDHHRKHDSTALLTRSILADLVARLRKKEWLTDELAKQDLATLLARIDAESVLKKMRVGPDDPPSLSGKALLRDIIEFMRAVHAEMAAVSSAAKRGVSVDGCVMYATAFPCHECARHIVMVGIGEVYFIDPYPKSRVPEMFDDSIVVDRDVKGKIPFRAFTGIAPRLYADAFVAPISTRWRWVARLGYLPNEADASALCLSEHVFGEGGRGLESLE